MAFLENEEPKPGEFQDTFTKYFTLFDIWAYLNTL